MATPSPGSESPPQLIREGAGLDLETRKHVTEADILKMLSSGIDAV
jgi:hypothetical protein